MLSFYNFALSKGRLSTLFLLSSDETVFGNKYAILQKNTVFDSKIFIYY